MKTFLVLFISAIILSSCCPEIKEITRTTTTEKDSLRDLPQIADSIFIQDPALQEWYESEVALLRLENDRLRGLPADTITKYLPTKPFKHTWQATKITQIGDSVFVTFRLENSNGTFSFRIVPAKINIPVTQIETVKTQEKELSWIEKIWSDFKDYILIGMIFILGVGMLYQRFR